MKLQKLLLRGLIKGVNLLHQDKLFLGYKILNIIKEGRVTN